MEVNEMTYLDHLEMEEALEQPLKEWYTATYPSDDLGYELPENETLGDAYKVLLNGENFYLFLNVGDSVVRERVFDKLSEIMGVGYDEIYNMWMKGWD